MDDFKPKTLKMLKIYLSSLLLKVKDPPDNAAELHEFIHGRKAPKLEV